MRLLILTIVTMLAFAGNSVLNRMALADGLIDPAGFALVRVLSGAVMLAVLVWWRDRKIVDMREISVWVMPSWLMVFHHKAMEDNEKQICSSFKDF